MSRIVSLALLLIVVAVGTASAAETSVHGRLYSHWGWDLTNGMNEFGLGRAYLTAKSKLSEYTRVRITTDLREAAIEDDGSEKTRYYVIVKYAYLDWKPNFGNKRLTLRLGLQPTPYIDYQNKLWGRRYLSKTVGDANSFLTSSDAGVSAYFALGEKGKTGSLGLSIFNGTSYSSLEEENKQKDVNIFARVNPLANVADFNKSALVAQFYTGTQNEAFNDSTLAGDYNKEIFSIGGMVDYRSLIQLGTDFNWLTKGVGADVNELKSSGLSFFGTLYLGELTPDSKALRTLNLFGRYDAYDPNTDADDDGEKLVMVGLECQATRGFRASVNIRQTSFDDDTMDSEKHLFVNTLFKF